MDTGQTDPERPFETHLARVLVRLREERAWGVLEVVHEGLPCEIFLSDGVPVFAEGGSVDDSLGRVLLRSGRLTPFAYARILERMTEALVADETMRFGEVAIELGLSSPEVIMAALTDQVRHKIERCIRHDVVSWTFREDRTALDGLARFPLRIEQVVVDALAEEHEATRWEARLVPFGDRFPTIRRTEGVMMTTLGLTATRFKIMRQCDGTHTLTEVLTSGSVERREAVTVVTALLLADRMELRPSPRVLEKSASARGESPSRPEQAPAVVAPHTNHHAPIEVDAVAHLRAELARRGRMARQNASARQHLSAEQSFELAKRHFREGRAPQAQAALSSARAGMPSSLEVRLWSEFLDYVLASDDAGRASRTSSLREMALEALRHDKNLAFGHHVLGRLFLDAGDDEAARRAFRIALRLDPDDVDAARFGHLLATRAKK